MADKSEFSNLKGFKTEKSTEKWTFKLFLCCLTASTAALQFGFCLSSLNTTTIPVQEFILKNFFLFENQNSPQNLTLSQNDNETEQLDLNRVSELKEIEIKKTLNLLWTFINCLFVLGQFIGGFASKFILEHLGRKNGFLFHNLVCLFASLLVIIAPYVSSPVCVMISRFLFGVQAGLGISIVPVYLSEIPPDSLRGAAGTFFQLFVSIGISLAQVFGFKEIFGNSSYWHLQLAFPIVPGLIGSIVFLIFLPESPKALLVKGDYEAAKKSLQMIRNKLEVTEELERINQETLQNSSSVSFKDLLKSQRMRWPLITTITLFVGLQASGINAIFFYSASIFKDAGIESNNIQYAILLTGLINIPSNIACMPLIDKFGRRNLMLITTCLAIVNYIVLTVLLTFKDVSWILSYSSIVCILLFIILFSLAIGPIPGIYVCEVFQVHSRGTAIAIANMIACVSFLFVAFAFPILQASINQYVFLVFAALLTVVFLILYQKMPETKGKSVEEIVTLF